MSSWDTSNVTNMSGMFFGCIIYNQPLNALVVTNVTDMSGMFSNCVVFNQPLDTWDVANVQNMSSLFSGASSFNQVVVASWDFASVTSMVNMITNTAFTTAQFTDVLVSLNANPTLPQNLTLGTTNLTFYNIVSLPNLSSMNILASSAPVYIFGQICFIADTPIHTDQGIVMINRIDPAIHTIRKQKIVAITQNVTQDKTMIKIEKDAFALNVPSQDTIISNNHKIMYKGKMLMAKEFIGFSDKIKKIEYSGEVLYNVLLEKYDMMIVNNLIAETLHPENRIAKLYNTYHFDKLDIMQKIYLMEDLNKIVLEQSRSIIRV